MEGRRSSRSSQQKKNNIEKTISPFWSISALAVHLDLTRWLVGSMVSGGTNGGKMKLF